MNTMRVCLLDQLLIPKAAVDEDVHLQTVGLLCAQHHLLTSGQLQTYLKRLCTCESRHPLSAEGKRELKEAYLELREVIGQKLPTDCIENYITHVLDDPQNDVEVNEEEARNCS
jgi:hypothetical protein